VVISDSDPISADLLNLSYSYRLGRPFVVGTTLYVPGTRRPTDILDDLMIPMDMVSYTFAYRDALDQLRANRGVDRIVGHSLGGAVAAELGRNFPLVTYGYGSPVRNDVNYADPFDPVGVFVRSRPSRNDSLFHHSVRGYM